MSITTSRRPNSLLDMVEVGGNYDHCCLKHYMCKIGILDFFTNFKRLFKGHLLVFIVQPIVIQLHA